MEHGEKIAQLLQTIRKGKKKQNKAKKIMPRSVSEGEGAIMYPIGLILMLKQPDVYEALIRIYNIPRAQAVFPEIVIAEIVEDEFTREQRELSRLMKIKPGWSRDREVE